MNYVMVVKIRIRAVPDHISIQEAKVTSELWVKTKIPDAELISFKKENN